MAIALETSSTLAPVFSQSSEIEFIDETRCAKKAFAVNLDNSEDHKLVVKMLVSGTQFW
ncbi:hypothetical protein D3C71_2143190 [compost metagenome]